MITIGKLREDDRAAWEELFRGYIDFYQRSIPDEQYDRSWREFMADNRIHALCARMDEKVVGIAHFFTHPHTNGPDVCYLQDLFTAPQARGQGAATALIEAVKQWAQEQGCVRLYWTTQETNATARRVYDKLTNYDGFVVYRMSI